MSKKLFITFLIVFLTSAVGAQTWNPDHEYPPGCYVVLDDGTRLTAYSEDGLLIDGSGSTISEIQNVTSVANVISVDLVDFVSAVTEIKNDVEVKVSTEHQGLGNITVNNDSAVELAFTGQTRSIIITASSGNTDFIYWGGSGVSNNGANSMGSIAPGAVIAFDYDDTTNAIYVISGSTAHSVIAGAFKQ